MIKGYSTIQAKGSIEHNSVQPLGHDKYGINIAPIMGLAPIDLISYVPEVTLFKDSLILTGHPVRVGDLIIFDSGALVGKEATVVEITPNSIVLGKTFGVIIAPTDTFRVYRPTNLALDANGNIVTTSGPIQYVLDSVNTQVLEDTAVPANNKPLPNKLFIQKDGITGPVNKDTATPSNTLAIPVEIVGTSGQVVTINAGDINVQTSHLGANADSMRIGDGVTEVGVTPTKDMRVYDEVGDNNLIAVQNLLSSIRTKQDSQSTEATLANVVGRLDQIIAEEATSAKQDALLAELVAQRNIRKTVHESIFNANAAMNTITYLPIGAIIPNGMELVEIVVAYKAGDTIELFDADGGNSIGMVTQGGGTLPISVVGNGALRIHARAVGANFTASDFVVNLVKRA